MLVLLLQGSAEDEDAKQEAYRSILSRVLPANAEVCRVPVLDFAFHKESVLALEREIDSGFDSVLMTSARSAMALDQYASQELKIKLRTKPWFVVGMGSKQAVQHMLQVEDVRGGETGCADELIRSEMMHACKRVAYLCGNLRKPTMADGMRAAGIDFKEFILYETVPCTEVELPKSEATKRRVCVFFSPSGVTAVGKQVNSASEDWIVAIGETTNRALLEADIKVHAVAKSPSAEGLADAIVSLLS